MSSPKPLRIGILYEETQMTDLAGLDILDNVSTKKFDMLLSMNPSLAPLRPLTVPMEFLYISSSLNTAWTTPEMHVTPTHTYTNAPRDLDILLLGGPDPSAVKEESLTFLREASLGCWMMMPKVDWQDQRWVIDDGHFEGAQIWTAGGAGCGIDMVIEYTLQNFDKKLVEMGCEGLDFEVEGRCQVYKAPIVNRW
ncbi:hypothetical protein E8E11_004379 [Didymella keratinophila]|nr:hypothetical protein E8E11_004379 [Didymella keratinophila]